ncbi:hypothetical protein SBA4_2490006 [Candidatus Sulfopaludibacter sp. SbA4]|nr:hypothetical protein SBA4_2490006 [Candidatus Sulfopaludibacter sp. SbA4]
MAPEDAESGGVGVGGQGPAPPTPARFQYRYTNIAASFFLPQSDIRRTLKD